MAQWLYKFYLKDLLDGDENVDREEAKLLGEEVAKRLEKNEVMAAFGIPNANKLIRLFRFDCLSQADFNAHLDVLYDYADARRVWVE